MYTQLLIYWIKHDDTRRIVDFKNLEDRRLGKIVDFEISKNLWVHRLKKLSILKISKIIDSKKSSILKSQKNLWGAIIIHFIDHLRNGSIY